jgi:uncharacterized membrane protein
MFTSLLMGGILIVCGFLAKAYPNLIAGYNTMSEKQKENVDIKGLSSFMRNAMVITGLVIIGSYYFFRWIGIDERQYALIPAGLTIIGAVVIVIVAQRYDHNK